MMSTSHCYKNSVQRSWDQKRNRTKARPIPWPILWPILRPNQNNLPRGSALQRANEPNRIRYPRISWVLLIANLRYDFWMTCLAIVCRWHCCSQIEVDAAEFIVEFWHWRTPEGEQDNTYCCDRQFFAQTIGVFVGTDSGQRIRSEALNQGHVLHVPFGWRMGTSQALQQTLQHGWRLEVCYTFNKWVRSAFILYGRLRKT